MNMLHVHDNTLIAFLWNHGYTMKRSVFVRLKGIVVQESDVPFSFLVPIWTIYIPASEHWVLMPNCLLLCLILRSGIIFFFLIGLATSKHWLRRQILGDSSSFACWQFLVLCSSRCVFNSLQSNTSGSGIYGASQSKTHPHDVTVKATLKHPSSSGAN